MTAERRRDKTSCAGGHRKRTNSSRGGTTRGYRDLSMPLARQAKFRREPASEADPEKCCLNMKPRFDLDSNSGSNLASSRLVDPEAYDASEQEFAASLERKAVPRFVVEAPEGL